MQETPDAIVIGSGPNGLVGANLLADRGWDVLVLEAQPDPGGAVRSGELTEPGFVHDRFSAFYPLAAASPVIRGLGLENFGLRWRHAPIALANPTPDGGCAVLSTDVDETAASRQLRPRRRRRLASAVRTVATSRPAPRRRAVDSVPARRRRRSPGRRGRAA